MFRVQKKLVLDDHVIVCNNYLKDCHLNQLSVPRTCDIIAPRYMTLTLNKAMTMLIVFHLCYLCMALLSYYFI